ncbi:MAG: SRPBCC domain-containing protein [Flavipsychrobacter sp.]
MKKLLLIAFQLFMMTTTNAQNGKATTIKKTFSRQTKVSIDINADAAIVWVLLTNASDFPRWNSTIVSIDGKIKQGEKIKLVSTLAPERVFKIKVKEMQPEKMMHWGDGKGDRYFTIEKNAKGGVTFTMEEKIGGLMFPMYAKYIPPFDENFEQYAKDLKKEAEIIANTK